MFSLIDARRAIKGVLPRVNQEGSQAPLGATALGVASRTQD